MTWTKVTTTGSMSRTLWINLDGACIIEPHSPDSSRIVFNGGEALIVFGHPDMIMIDAKNSPFAK